MTKKKTQSTADRDKQEDKVDRQMRESFPASDPPAFAGGQHFIGAPKERKSKRTSPKSRDVERAERKVRDGRARNPENY